MLVLGILILQREILEIIKKFQKELIHRIISIIGTALIPDGTFKIECIEKFFYEDIFYTELPDAR